MNNNLTEPYVSAGQLNIPAGIFFTRQPQRAAASGPDQTAVFKVTAINAVSYQWQLNDGSGWTDIDGAESDTFETVIGPGMHGWKFRCVVEDADGASAASSAAAITVSNTSRITMSGAVETIDYGPVNIDSLVVDIDAVQSGTGDPSPDNIRPISGWDAVNVFVRGINQWDEQWEVGSYDPNGEEVSASSRIRSKNKIPCVPNTAYFVACTGNYSSWVTVHFYDSDDNHISYAVPNVNSTFATPKNAHYITFNTSDAYGTTYKNDICINYPSTDHNYHAYNGTTHPITLFDTCYGGTLDVTSGVLTVTHGYIASYADEDLPGTWISDRDVYAEGTAPTAGAEVVYELAEPITVTLTATEVSTILGYNNIFADSGEVEVIYQGWPNAEPESELVGLGSLNPNAIQDVFTPGVIEDIPQTLDITPEFDTLL